MAKGINLDIAADTRSAMSAINRGILDPLEEVTDELEQIAKEGDDALETITKEARRSQKETDELGDKVREVRDELNKAGRAGKKYGDDIESGTKSGFSAASENVEEFKDEALQNFSEVTSSFTGDMESAVDLVQGTLGGLASGIGGPLGLALGVAGAAVGLVTANLIESEEKLRELKERAREFAIEAVNASMGTDEWLSSAEQVVARIQELEQLTGLHGRWWFQEDPTHLEHWIDSLRDVGREGSEVRKVLQMSTDDMKDYRAGITAARDALLDERDALLRSKDASEDKVAALLKEQVGYETIIDLLDDEITTRDEAAASAERQSQVGIDAMLAEVDAAEERAERIESAQQAVESSVTSAYDNMRQAATDYATDEEGALDINRWLEYTQQHAAAVEAYHENLAKMKLTPEQAQNLLEIPEAQRMQWVAQFVALPEDARGPFEAALNDLGATAGRDAAMSLEGAFAPETSVVIETDTAQAEREVSTFTSKRRTATIKFVPDFSEANRAADRWRRNQANRPIYVQGRFLE